MCIAGNPRVTPEVTRDVCLLARMMAANMYFSQIEDLMFEVLNMLASIYDLFYFIIQGTVLNFLLLVHSWQLSMWRCSDELRVCADELLRSSKRDAKHFIGM